MSIEAAFAQASFLKAERQLKPVNAAIVWSHHTKTSILIGSH
jgi:hypothetical protein